MSSTSNAKKAVAAPPPCQVRVGVRVRPLTGQEEGQGGRAVLRVVPPAEVRLGERRFTYDAVFDAGVDQTELYAQVSRPLLTSFLEGYNATIMAYGQTGSGKTFTMGSEAHTELEISDNTGLIPRFMYDLFHNLEQQRSGDGSFQFALQASFLEVYGEDVHDLLDASRTPLPLREDAAGGVICAGLTHRAVAGAAQALAVLHEGTLNRTTAATLMNLTSSRSHAIFTVTLTQTQRVDGGGEVVTTSRFTFVDLAGSERMKKTGAEGERAREGIKINEGLLALGNVINALADEERLNSGKPIHVPYRQSKLTRLLQDALGGNSQTLFLACVSPSDTNASETLSTMHYANRARNIKNAPTRNVDAGALEVQRLQSLTRVLQAELIKQKFAANIDTSALGECDPELIRRQDVSEYLDRLQTAALEKQDQQGPLFARKPSVTASAPTTFAASVGQLERRVEVAQASSLNDSMRFDGDPNKSIMEHFNPLGDVNPDEDMAILDQLLELQQRDNDFQKTQQEENAELKQVEGQIFEQQSLLLQLRESLKVYHDMKEKYEILMAEVRHLEVEKTQLMEQLDKAHADPTKGCSKAIKKELEKVEQALARARNESRKHREKYRQVEQEAKKSAVLQRKISELKMGRARLIKKQEETAARHREYTEARTREILALKRKDRSNEQRVSKMQKEIQMHKKNLDKRQEYCMKLKEKLDQTEAHLMKLLALRNQELRERTSAVSFSRRRSSVFSNKSNFRLPESNTAFSPPSETVNSIIYLLDQAVSEKLSAVELDQRYEECISEYSEAMRNMVEAVKALEQARASATKMSDAEKSESHYELLQNVEDTELKVELLSEELDSLRQQFAEREMAGNNKVTAERLIRDKDAPLLRTVLLETLDKLTESRVSQNRFERAIQRKTSVINGLENEIQILNERIEALTKTNDLRQTLDESGEDVVEKINQLTSENRSMISQLEKTKMELSKIESALMESRRENEVLVTLRQEAEEKSVLAQRAVKSTDSVVASQTALEKIQNIWRELGRPSDTDQQPDIKQNIENCLDDTCVRLLQEASQLKEKTLSELNALNAEINHMCASLGLPPDTGACNGSLFEQLKSIRHVHATLEPTYKEAINRRNKIQQQASDLITLLGLSQDEIPKDLISIVKAESNQADLREDFLSSCEANVSELRVRKSRMLASSAQLLNDTFDLVTTMNLPEDQILPLVLTSVKRRSREVPKWWDKEIAETVARAASKPGGIVRATHAYHEHLLLIHTSLVSISRPRQVLSDRLKELVEKSQQVLIQAVDGEVEAIEAYASFHDALFRLPSLSRERMKACTTEIDALLVCVDDMTQSEVEALVVVHDALNVSSNDRGAFWGEVEEATRAVETNVNGPFDEVIQLSTADGEEWVLQLVKEATKNYRKLESRLTKLELIHSEVERLRSRQDAKSKIISLDSEVRTLSARLSEFENTKCNKQRLLTKKSGSVNLLKEERFRKQMQQTFASKLEKLASLLQQWRKDNHKDFESNLLSDEVKLLLENGGNMTGWVEKRTEFMHLRTTQTSKKPRTESSSVKRISPPQNVEQSGSAVSASRSSVTRKASSAGLPPAPAPPADSRKRKAPDAAPRPPSLPAAPARPARTTRSTRGVQSLAPPPRPPLAATAAAAAAAAEPPKPPRPQRSRVPPAASDDKPASGAAAATTADPRKKRKTLPPFGNVLALAATPRKDTSDKENARRSP